MTSLRLSSMPSDMPMVHLQACCVPPWSILSSWHARPHPSWTYALDQYLWRSAVCGKQIHSEMDFWRIVSCEPVFFGEKGGPFFWVPFLGGDMSSDQWLIILSGLSPTWGALCASHGKHWIARKAPILNHKTTGAPTLQSLWKSRGSQRMTTRLQRREGSPF